MADVELNWATATVKDGKLAVDLDGKPSSAWKRSFETTAALLRGGDWGAIELKKHAVRVSDVPPGGEEKLRHHLESLVEQANAAVRASESEAPERSDDEDGEPDSPDTRMTEAFRAFADDAAAERQAQ